MAPRKIAVTVLTFAGGAAGLFAPIGFVKWLLRTDPEEAGILTLFFLVPARGARPADRAQGRTARDRQQAGRAEIKQRGRHDRSGRLPPFPCPALCDHDLMAWSATVRAIAEMNALQHLIEQLTHLPRRAAMLKHLVKQ